jgi:hypothetical protein
MLNVEWLADRSATPSFNIEHSTSNIQHSAFLAKAEGAR